MTTDVMDRQARAGLSGSAEPELDARDHRSLSQLAVESGWDMWLVGATAAIVLYGLVMVVSASSHYALALYDTPWGYGIRQLVGVLLGLAGAALIVAMPREWFLRLPTPVFAASLVLLALVQTPLGHAAKGAPRWVHLGPVNLQPSEIAKIGLSMVFAAHLARNEGRIRDVMGVVLPAVVVYLGPMLVLVHLQSDLGTMALMAGIVGVALFVAGLEWRYLLTSVGAAAVGAALLILYEPYRARRVLSFLDPHADPEGSGYQVVQGWVALAVGGVGGQGLGNGVAQQGFLPEAHTDMIMAVVAEELGVFGWSSVFVLHVIILWRGMRIATEARGLYEMVLASCLSSVVAVQVFINTAVIGGLVPPKGLVLPFMSYGASAIMANLWSVAILLRIGFDNRDGARALRDPTGPASSVEV